MSKKSWPPTTISIVSDDAKDQAETKIEPILENKIETLKKVQVTAGSLNVRRSPIKDAPILFRVAKDTILEVVLDAESENWIYVSTLDGRTGYVMKVFTEPLRE